MPDTAALQARLKHLHRSLRQPLERRLHTWQQSLDHARARLQALRPQLRLQRGGERLRALHTRLQRIGQQSLDVCRWRLQQARSTLHAHTPAHQLEPYRERVDQRRQRLQRAMHSQIQRQRGTLAAHAHALRAVSPLATLERGYAILFDADAKVVRSVASVDKGAMLNARLTDGTLLLQRR